MVASSSGAAAAFPARGDPVHGTMREMFSFGRKLIKVTFRDESQAVVSAVRMPLERLPDTFPPGTELNMAGGRYVVVSAQPDTKAKATDVGQLDVVVRKRVSPA